jgi:hypothetical protein
LRANSIESNQKDKKTKVKKRELNHTKKTSIKKKQGYPDKPLKPDLISKHCIL